MKGILFKEDLFRAVIEGRKTQTRRLTGLEEVNQNIDSCELVGWSRDPAEFELADTCDSIIASPRYKIGETVSLKEPYYLPSSGEFVVYAFDLPDVNRHHYPFKNKLFMPAKYARFWINITKIRVERLFDISENDAIAEGIEPLYCVNNTPSYKLGFLKVWHDLNGNNFVFNNPWVWVYEFELNEFGF